MAATGPARRLTSIMAADVVGYSRLVEADEAGALAALKELRQTVLEPLLAEHHGRLVKLMGDGLIAEFGSVVDAVACTAAIQTYLASSQERPRRSAGSSCASASTWATWLSRGTISWATASTWRPVWSRPAYQEAC